MTVLSPGSFLTDETSGSCSMVIDGPMDPLVALLDFIEETYGGDRLDPANPIIQRALPDVTVEEWRNCTADYPHWDTEAYTGWWAPDGDGDESMWMVSLPYSAYDLGEEAHCADDGSTEE